MVAPSTNEPANGNGKGRGARGRFAPGNPGGPGNPHAADVGRLRAKFFAGIRDADVDKALATIREIMGDAKAKHADRLAAARELLDRVIGKPAPAEPPEERPDLPALADVDLRNCTAHELQTLREILAAATRRAGRPVGDGGACGN